MGRKAAETACNINQVFGQETVKKYTAQYCFQTFSNGNESLDDEESCRFCD